MDVVATKEDSYFASDTSPDPPTEAVTSLEAGVGNGKFLVG